MYNCVTHRPLSYLEISSRNLLFNLKLFRDLIGPKTQLAAAIKGNAYGHGQNTVASILDKHTDYFQLDDIEELQILRKISHKEVLLLGYVATPDLERAVNLKCVPAIYDTRRLLALEQIGKKLTKRIKVHLKIDALLGRQGVTLVDLPSFLKLASEMKFVTIEGIYSHLSDTNDPKDQGHTLKQLAKFQQSVSLFRQVMHSQPKTHISATSGVVLVHNRFFKADIVRIGAGLYGYWPSENLKKAYNRKLPLKPVIRWVSHIAQVKKLSKNYPIGYSRTYVTKKPITIAVIPQGYSDGYDRGLSNVGQVLIKGIRCPVIGRVSMNMMTVDISHVPSVRQEDEVVLLGLQKREIITADEIASQIKTINYEVTTRISPLLPRITT